jgi:hypothetical protein
LWIIFGEILIFYTKLVSFAEMNLLAASIEVSLAPGYPTLEFAASGGVLNSKRE